VRNHLHALVTYDGRARAVQFDTLPRACPCCGEQCAPWRLSARATSPDDGLVDFAFQCSRPACRRVFVVRYHRVAGGEYELQREDAERWCEELLTLHS
jgi:hypothetical protein